MRKSRWFGLALGAWAMLEMTTAAWTQAKIIGVEGTSFDFVARQDRITLGDGDSMLMWGFALGEGRMQYPGPTLILRQGDTVTVTLRNSLPREAGNVSIVFPGHEVTASGGVEGVLTREAPPDNTTVVTYTFTATRPGTYVYHSGTRPDLQVEMGLVGVIVVRPASPTPTPDCPPVPKGHNEAPPRSLCAGTKFAYDHPDTAYDREFLILMTDMDPRVHRLVEFGRIKEIDTTNFFQTVWFANGRNFPDTIANAQVPWLPTQPYNALFLMHPGERLLVRMATLGRDPHPLHFHGNHVRVIAKDGVLLSSGLGAGSDLSYERYTVAVNPCETVDAIYTWTGALMGWDIYGHAPGDPLAPYEFIGDHGANFPVILPSRDDVKFGQLYSGSPFLGGEGFLPPEHAGLNVGGGFFYMWHSHTEKELANNNVFPGGLITFLGVVPWNVPLESE
jgi:FtsP/CotA-like multicopper oxidase with cupredoxin domain